MREEETPHLGLVATLSATFVRRAITPQPKLEEITSCVVLYFGEKGEETAHAYRHSSSARGKESRDSYTLKNGKWKHQGKAPKKYSQETLSYPPLGCAQTKIDGVLVYTVHPLSEKDGEYLRSLISVLPTT